MCCGPSAAFTTCVIPRSTNRLLFWAVALSATQKKTEVMQLLVVLFPTMAQYVSMCLWTHHWWLKCTDLYLSNQLAKYWACLQQQFHNQIDILHQGPEVRMSLTHLRCRGRAKPRWQLQWDVCSSAEGWADRRWEVSGTLAPPLASCSTSLWLCHYQEINLTQYFDNYQTSVFLWISQQKFYCPLLVLSFCMHWEIEEDINSNLSGAACSVFHLSRLSVLFKGRPPLERDSWRCQTLGRSRLDYLFLRWLWQNAGCLFADIFNYGSTAVFTVVIAE